MTDDKFVPRIVGFLCNWCSYRGADLAGLSRLQYPANLKVIRVMCSGRVNPLYILKAFQMGNDGVLVSGCHPGECHYIAGNLYARRRFTMLRSLLEYLGIEPERFRVSWVSASEGNKFAEIVKKMSEDLQKLGPIKQLRRENKW